MKKPKQFQGLFKAFVLICSLTFIQGHEPMSPSPETYTGTSPCNQAVRPFLSIPAEMNCEMVKWKITLSRNPESPVDSRFALEYSYGMSQNGTQGLTAKAETAVKTGKWKTAKSTTANPGSTLLTLIPSQSEKAITFLQMDENVMHLLDTDGRLMIGNAAWSYTVYKISKSSH